MDFKDRWQIIAKLCKGGQGRVYRVLDTSKVNIENHIIPAFKKTFRELAHPDERKETWINYVEAFRKAVFDIIRLEDPVNHGALKVLHEPQDARDHERAEDRIKNEIKAMYQISHPNMLKILDYDEDETKWFVSEFHPKGSLVKNDNKNRFTGNFVAALRAFRPLVEGVSELHKDGMVHRDIKPGNVFLDSTYNLVLGDFGLIFFTDEQHTRISGTFQNVGSRDWMPPWAMGMRIEEIAPTFDVFCLGKLLWAMVSKLPVLQLWYFDRSPFNLEEMFPEAPYIKFANRLFKKCIVENKEDCLPDATALLDEVDKVLTIIDRHGDQIEPNVKRHCKVCGIGDYELIADKNLSNTRNLGFNPTSGNEYKIFACNHCGHVQLFSFLYNREPPQAWSGV